VHALDRSTTVTGEATHTCLEKTDTTTKAGQEHMRADIKTGLEEMSASQENMEANQERKEATTGSTRKAKHLLTVTQSRVCDVSNRAPKRGDHNDK
jgi:hypothetical protein